MTCNVSLIFTPSAGGLRNATFTITDNANAASSAAQVASLLGTGKDFTLTASTSSTISPGQSTAYTLTVTPQGGFTGGVQLTCVEPSDLGESTCTVSPGSVTLNGSSTSTATVTVTSTEPSNVPMRRLKWPSGLHRRPELWNPRLLTATLLSLLWPSFD